jgi:predicted enzyme related to lactoylglutathione lyase
MIKPAFTPGKNLAMKVPVHEYEKTVSFYRDILGLEQVDSPSPNSYESVAFKFGDKKLWIDKIEGISQAEIWLEVITDDLETVAKYIEENKCVRRDEIEPLPKGLKGFWISNPANIIHLITEAK